MESHHASDHGRRGIPDQTKKNNEKNLARARNQILLVKKLKVVCLVGAVPLLKEA